MAGLAAAAAQTPGTGLALGLVRSDGIMVPFAVFDDGKWVDAWPDPVDGRVLDRMIEALPSYWRNRGQQIPEVWHAADHPSHKPVPIRVLTHVIFEEHCETQSGVLTDRVRAKADLHDRTLTMSWPATLEWPIDILAAGVNRAPWQPLIDRARSEVAKGEPKSLTALHGFLDGELRVVAWKAERAVRKNESTNTLGGFIVADRGVVRVLDSSEWARTVLGIIRPAATPLWVVLEHGYEGESVSLFTVGASGAERVFNKYLGGC